MNLTKLKVVHDIHGSSEVIAGLIAEFYSNQYTQHAPLSDARIPGKLTLSKKSKRKSTRKRTGDEISG